MTTWNFDNTYSQLPKQLFSLQHPTKVQNPSLVVLNEALAEQLDLDFLKNQPDKTVQWLSGNVIPEGANPLAQAYAGHQFGHFTTLGDGRAILLGELKATDAKRYDIQLKGSGQTSFSRRGDGRATLSSMLREYLMSEALYHLGVPSTRSLAVVRTGEQVFREAIHEGGILTRVARSHIRVGTFEYVRKFCSTETLQAFLSYVLDRHYPELSEAPNPALALVEAVMHTQASLVVHWMRIGFIHGVMNTDNTSIVGETIDYGPCAFMNRYDLQTVYSSIDRQGRYAYGNQPSIMHWNLTVLADALLPLIDTDVEKAIEKVKNVLENYPKLYWQKWYHMMFKKLGLSGAAVTDVGIVKDLMKLLENRQPDYTNFFTALRTGNDTDELIFKDTDFQQWKSKWLEQIAPYREEAMQKMAEANPFIIPRNHLVEDVLKKAAKGDLEPFKQLLDDLKTPYSMDDAIDFQEVPQGFDQAYQTFCGT